MLRAIGFTVVATCLSAGPAAAQAAPKGDPAGAAVAGVSVAVVLALGAAGLLFYFAPTAIALLRGHANTASIAVVNLFLGWSLVGWVVALAWSFSATEDRSRYRAG